MMHTDRIEDSPALFAWIGLMRWKAEKFTVSASECVGAMTRTR